MENSKQPLDDNDSEPAMDQDASNDYLKLRQLLLGDDYQAALQQYLSGEDDVRRISQALPEALQQVEKKQLGETLAPVVDEAINASIENNPSSITDVIFPIMGPAIRKAVSSALAEMVQSLNTLLEQSLTLGSLKWRFGAWRAGIPYAQYVLLQTTQYRVEQVLLVHRETGLLLQSITAAEIEAQDPELVSSMLTAISDFVSDSFSSGQETLEKVRLGDLELQLLAGPHAVLAVAVRGNTSDDLVRIAHHTIEQIHAEFNLDLINFDGDRDKFESVVPLLSNCLLSKAVSQDKKHKPWFAVIVLIAGAVYFSLSQFNQWQIHQQVEAVSVALMQEPGYVVISSSRTDGILRTDILRSPNSRSVEQVVPSHIASGKVRVQVTDRIVQFGVAIDDMSAFINQVQEINNTRFYFASNTAVLPEHELHKIPVLVKRITALVDYANALGIRDLQLMVMGFADGMGARAKNTAVSQARANAIKSLLQDNLPQMDFAVAWGLGSIDGQGISHTSQRRVQLSILYDEPILEHKHTSYADATHHTGALRE